MKKGPLEYALYLIEMRDRSTYEIKSKMQQKNFSHEEIDSTIAFLKEKHFLNDNRFAERMTQNYINFRGKGRNAIALKLYQLGIEKSIADEALGKIDNEEEAAKDAAQKWLARKEGKEIVNLQTKLMQYLSGRGFSYEIIKNVVETLKI